MYFILRQRSVLNPGYDKGQYLTLDKTKDNKNTQLNTSLDPNHNRKYIASD